MDLLNAASRGNQGHSVLLDTENQSFNQSLLTGAMSLVSICRGLTTDSMLDHAEILFLDTWLADNESATRHWPGDVLANTVARMMRDGIVTANELENLRAMLNLIIDGNFERDEQAA